MMPLICICWRYLYVNSWCVQLAAESTRFSLQPSLITQQRERFRHFNQWPQSAVKSRVDVFYGKRRLPGTYSVYRWDLRSGLCSRFHFLITWCCPNTGSRPHPVRSRKRNPEIIFSPLCHCCTFGCFSQNGSNIFPGVFVKDWMRGTAGATTGKMKGVFSHYVPPGFLPLEGKCSASMHRLGR